MRERPSVWLREEQFCAKRRQRPPRRVRAYGAAGEYRGGGGAGGAAEEQPGGREGGRRRPWGPATLCPQQRRGRGLAGQGVGQLSALRPAGVPRASAGAAAAGPSCGPAVGGGPVTSSAGAAPASVWPWTPAAPPRNVRDVGVGKLKLL